MIIFQEHFIKQKVMLGISADDTNKNSNKTVHQSSKRAPNLGPFFAFSKVQFKNEIREHAISKHIPLIYCLPKFKLVQLQLI